MKTKWLWLVIPPALFLSSCLPANPPAPEKAIPPVETFQPSSTSNPVPAPTLASIPTLPPTLTPVPTQTLVQVTPTQIYASQKLSPGDEEAFQKGLKDIPLYRQGDLQINLQDEEGNPLSGYIVKYRQVSHDFLFGGISNNFDIAKIMKSGINSWSIYLDWSWVEPEYGKFNLDFTNYWLGIDELKSGGMTLRSNVLYDPGNLPPYYGDIPYDEFLKRLSEHVSTTVKRFAPSVDFWEAVLEPNFGNHNPYHLSKDQYYQAIATSIKAIRDNDPTAKVEINLSYPCGGIDWLNNYQIIQEMLDRKLDFDLVGLQFYYNAYIGASNYQMTKLSLADMNACYDKYEKMLAPYGKKIVGSEVSVPSEAPAGQKGYWKINWSEDTQAQYLETAYTIFFSKPSNLGLVWWNTIEPSSFVYHGGLVSEDGTPKKSFYVLQHLISSWTSSGESPTGQNGSARFRGFGGDYEIKIINPATGESMITQAHLTEQKSTNEIIKFFPNNLLLQKKTDLEKLVNYWLSKSDQVRGQKGKDYLALVNYHMQVSEWSLAEQTINAALDDLVIQTEIIIPVTAWVPVGYENGLVQENGSALMWASTALHLSHDFPVGTVSVEIQAHSHSEKGEYPSMVSGVGANYSQVWRVENSQADVYSYIVQTTGREKDFTIRFPYDDRINQSIIAQNGDVGALKLFIDQVKLTIKTAQIP